MKRSNDLASLRALTALGLRGEVYIPALLEMLHDLIPSDRNLFDWTDPSGRLVRYYFEGTVDPEINRHYFENFHNSRESEIMLSFQEAVTGRSVIHGAESLDRPEFYRSSLYNEIWRPQRLHARIEAVIKDRSGRPLGSLVLYRGPGERKFSRTEEQLLAQIAPHVARGLSVSGDEFATPEYVVNKNRRAALSLEGGELRGLSHEAIKLLLLAHGGVTPTGASRPPRREDFPTLTAVWQHHQHAGSDGGGNIAMTVENAWGRFLFTSCLLSPVTDGAEPTVYVTVEHHEPKAVATRRALNTLLITPRQREVCQLLRSGYSQAEIAKVMEVSQATVADHVKKIYQKLDIHSVRDLTDVINQLAE